MKALQLEMRLRTPKSSKKRSWLSRWISKESDVYVAVLKNAFTALEKLAMLSNFSRHAIADLGAIDHVVWALGEFEEDPFLQMVGCSALECIMIDSPENRKTVIKKGGLDSILESMRRNPRQQYIQGHGSAALAHLVSDAGGDAAVVMAEPKNLDLLVKPLRRPGRQGWVHGHACSALAHLMAGLDAEDAKSAAEHLASSGGLQVVGQILRTCSGDETNTWLKDQVCLLLRNIIQKAMPASEVDAHLTEANVSYALCIDGDNGGCTDNSTCFVPET
eukprot:TRINITY_DN86373_c0_g1_i1.p1 TRINITY_DN86373_c0_g1~~TRINITY_DN86373_c0_g1_i1.p1  ORF type:complete len:276 (+),score=44.00 TRINITY_DN86373_c0_g1_i1:1-828(+)